ncbi:MAG TPA: cation diffusion facilitator family transporter [Chitinophagaceae bacterium]|nr:cation diffusion facilitator family transporter [Chitinophagaceae bacterium]
MRKAQQNFRIQLWITTLSVVLFVVKIIAYYLTNSLAILSDALESIVNMLAGFIGLFSLYVAAKPRDDEHPYGHGKAEFVSAAAEGSLIIAAGFFIVYETVQNIITKSPIEKLDTGLILVAVTAVINYVAGSICFKLGKKNNSLALQASGKHLQIDTYSTIGVIGGLIIILFTQLYWLDKLIAALLSILIIYNGYKILRSSLAGIMDEADMHLIKQFVDVLNNNRSENWIDVHNLRLIKYGSTLHIDCHLTVPWYITVHEAHEEVEALGKIIGKTFGEAIDFFVHTDGCLPFSCSICTKNDCEKRQHPFTHQIEWTLKNIITNQKHNSDL